jgi:hypothetical protein
MDLLYPLIGGISGKVYDDIVDEGIPVSDTFKEALKGIQWITLALASVGDFNYTFIQFIFNVLNHLGNPDAFKFPYEYSLLLVYPIFLFLSFHTRKELHYIDSIPLIITAVAMYFEPMFITENISYKKFLIRSFGSLSYTILLIFGGYFNVNSGIIKFSIYAIGYGVTSALFQFYMLTKSNSKETQAPESKEPKESQAPEPKEPQAPEPKEPK